MNSIDYYKYLRADGFHPELKIKAFYEKFRPIRCALDLGANNGFHSLGLARAHPQGKVYAVEAGEATFGELKQKIAAANLGHQITPVYAAVQDDPTLETVEFNFCVDHPGRSGIHPFWFELPPERRVEMSYAPPVKVPAITVDKLMDQNGLPNLDFCKADLEGGEYSALCGARHTMRVHRPVVVFERSLDAEKHYRYTKDDWFKLFAEAGYRQMAFDGSTLSDKNYYDFWYVFAAPNESADKVAEILRAVRDES
jgi:FkbM family methyltransferase